MGAIDRFRAGQALGGGTALAAANPKNLLLAVGGAAAIAQTGIPASQQAIAYAVFAIIGTLGVGAPVGIYLAMGKRSVELLGGLKDWMGQHNAVIMAVLCLVIGASCSATRSAHSPHDRAGAALRWRRPSAGEPWARPRCWSGR
jgi:hypothetical protein